MATLEVPAHSGLTGMSSSFSVQSFSSSYQPRNIGGGLNKLLSAFCLYLLPTQCFQTELRCHNRKIPQPPQLLSPCGSQRRTVCLLCLAQNLVHPWSETINPHWHKHYRPTLLYRKKRQQVDQFLSIHFRQFLCKYLLMLFAFAVAKSASALRSPKTFWMYQVSRRPSSWALQLQVHNRL